MKRGNLLLTDSSILLTKTKEESLSILQNERYPTYHPKPYQNQLFPPNNFDEIIKYLRMRSNDNIDNEIITASSFHPGLKTINVTFFDDPSTLFRIDKAGLKWMDLF